MNNHFNMSAKASCILIKAEDKLKATVICKKCGLVRSHKEICENCGFRDPIKEQVDE